MSARSLGICLDYGTTLRIQLDRFQVCFHDKTGRRRKIIWSVRHRASMFQRIPLRNYDLLDRELTRLSLSTYIFPVEFSGPVKYPNTYGTYSLHFDQISPVFSQLRATLATIMESHGIDKGGLIGLDPRHFESSIRRTPQKVISTHIPKAAADEVLKKAIELPPPMGSAIGLSLIELAMGKPQDISTYRPGSRKDYSFRSIAEMKEGSTE